MYKRLGILLPALCLVAMTLAAPAQTRRKKPANPAPSPTPAVVSQADLYKAQSQQIIENSADPNARPSETPTPLPETTDEKLDKISKGLADLNDRMKSVEGNRQSEGDEKQKRLLMNLDILTRAEQRSDSLRKQLYEMIERENSVKTKLEQLDYDLRPESINRQVAFAGTMRPEELRELRRKNLETERKNLSELLIQIQSTRASLEASVQKADELVAKLRTKLEKEIDDALADTP